MSSGPVRVPLGDRAYDIHIGTGLLPGLGALCAPVCRGRACLVVTDANVGPLHAVACLDSLRAAGFAPVLAEVPAGEGSKCAAQLDRLWGAASDAGLDRRSMIVALGGGVVGDLAGFLAASFLRGVTFVQVPTSLLAMVDSSVGGKTGINLPQGKNLVGAFHQPALVVADLSLLATLPRREFAAGMAEVVKYGVIRDAPFFHWLEQSFSDIQRQDVAALERVVRRSCELKAGVVGEDETETGVRAILNFGHTLGHAIEQAGGYGRWLHGEAIAMGMVYACLLSETQTGFPPDHTGRVAALLRAFDRPVGAPDLPLEALLEPMRRDKKSVDRSLRFVLASELGRVGLPRDVALDAVTEAWRRFQ
ncbi:MAG: 3-dehydroquinate synthase [Kiritimatiellia bacterium]